MKDEAVQKEFLAAETTLISLADRAGIEEAWNTAWGRLNERQRRQKVDSVIKNWPSIVAHYVDAAKWDSLKVRPRQSTDGPFGIPHQAEQIATISAGNAKDEKALEEIRRNAARQHDVRGATLAPGSPEFDREYRWQAVKAGLSPSSSAMLLVGLRKSNDQWHVVAIGVAPGGS